MLTPLFFFLSKLPFRGGNVESHVNVLAVRTQRTVPKLPNAPSKCSSLTSRCFDPKWLTVQSNLIRETKRVLCFWLLADCGHREWEDGSQPACQSYLSTRSDTNPAPPWGRTELLGNVVYFPRWLEWVLFITHTHTFKTRQERQMFESSGWIADATQKFLQDACLCYRFDTRFPVSRLLPPTQTPDLSSCLTQCGVCSLDKAWP